MATNNKTPIPPARMTGRLKSGNTIADVMSTDEIYNHVFCELVATFDRMTERLADSELQEEQSEIASTLARLGTAIMLHKMTDTLNGIRREIPDGGYIAEAIKELADAVERLQTEPEE